MSVAQTAEDDGGTATEVPCDGAGVIKRHLKSSFTVTHCDAMVRSGVP